MANGVGALLSFGLAGGLRPGLKPGALVLGVRVLPPSGPPLATDAAWRQRVLAWCDAEGIELELATIAGSARWVTTPEEKATLHAATGAAILDMESHLVAQAAEAAGIPFVAIRAVADPAERPVPDVARRALRPDGRIRHVRIAASLAARPRQLPATLRLAADYRRALRALGRVGRSGAALFSDG